MTTTPPDTAQPAPVQPNAVPLSEAKPAAAQPRLERLKRSADFAHVMRSARRRSHHRLLQLAATESGRDATRVGFSVSRRVGNAVRRNRVRRRLRAIVRQLPIADGFDIVIVAQPLSAEATYDELLAAAEESARRAHLLSGPDLNQPDRPPSP